MTIPEGEKPAQSPEEARAARQRELYPAAEPVHASARRLRDGLLLPIAVVIGIAVTAAMYIGLPELESSGRLLAIDQRLERATENQDAARSVFDEDPADAEATARLVEADREAVAAREALHALPFLESYQLKIVRRGEHLVGAVILHLIGGVLVVALAYLAGLLLLRPYPGSRLRIAPKDDPDLDLRLKRLARHWYQTCEVDAVRAENDSLSAADEGRVAFFLLPVKWSAWIMPILGFIGTVVGVTGAIGSLQLGIRRVFADRVMTAEALESFNRGFSNLGLAFDTTFFGLLGLAVVGTCDMFLRRRSLATIAAIDAEGQNHLSQLAAKEELADVEEGDLLETLRELKEWFDETAKEGFETQFEEFPRLAAILSEQLPELLDKLNKRTAGQIRDVVSDFTGELAARVTAYGEALARIAGTQAADTQTLRRLHEFLVRCLNQGGLAIQQHPFWQAFLHGLSTPLAFKAEMELIQQPLEGVEVEAVALSSGPYRLAVANKSRQDGTTTIAVHSLSLAGGEAIQVQPLSANRMDASVLAMAFDDRARRLAYSLSDGAVGLHDLFGEGVAQLVLEGVGQPGCLSWWRAGVQGIVLPVERGTSTVFSFLPAGSPPDANGDESDSVQLDPERLRELVIEDFSCSVMVVDHVHRKAFLAGRRADRAVVVVIGMASESFVVTSEFALEGAGVVHLSVGGPDHDLLYCALSDGKLVEYSLSDGMQVRARDLGHDSTLLAAADDVHRHVACVAEGSVEVLLLETLGLGEAARVHAHGAVCAAAYSRNQRVIAVGGVDGHAAIWEFPYYIVS